MSHRLLFRLIVALCLLSWLPASAAEEPPLREDAIVLETLVVSGTMPGPGLWKVSRDGHTMWILGTVQPVARRMEWESDAVAERIAAAQTVLLPPGVKFDTGMGRLRSMMLIPTLLGARKNPDGDKLVEHVPPGDYARWLVLKQKYLGRDRGVEKRRPIFAAQELYQAAVEKSGLRFKGMVSPLIDKITKKHGIPTHRPRIEITISDPKAVLRRFRETTLDDAECFRKTLDHLESDLEKMRIRANAWARGDMLTLREVTYEDQSQACTEAMLESGIAREQGIDDLPERVEAAWLEAAETIISERQTSFAALPIGHLVATDGYLAKLAARGYTIEAP